MFLTRDQVAGENSIFNMQFICPTQESCAANKFNFSKLCCHQKHVSIRWICAKRSILNKNMSISIKKDFQRLIWRTMLVTLTCFSALSNFEVRSCCWKGNAGITWVVPLHFIKCAAVKTPPLLSSITSKQLVAVFQRFPPSISSLIDQCHILHSYLISPPTEKLRSLVKNNFLY